MEPPEGSPPGHVRCGLCTPSLSTKSAAMLGRRSTLSHAQVMHSCCKIELPSASSSQVATTKSTYHTIGVNAITFQATGDVYLVGAWSPRTRSMIRGRVGFADIYVSVALGLCYRSLCWCFSTSHPSLDRDNSPCSPHSAPSPSAAATPTLRRALVAANILLQHRGSLLHTPPCSLSR